MMGREEKGPQGATPAKGKKKQAIEFRLTLHAEEDRHLLPREEKTGRRGDRLAKNEKVRDSPDRQAARRKENRTSFHRREKRPRCAVKKEKGRKKRGDARSSLKCFFHSWWLPARSEKFPGTTPGSRKKRKEKKKEGGSKGGRLLPLTFTACSRTKRGADVRPWPGRKPSPKPTRRRKGEKKNNRRRSKTLRSQPENPKKKKPPYQEKGKRRKGRKGITTNLITSGSGSF